ncbi:MAG TPA: hypothetical protein VFM97_00190 [Gammaproteobacteria bacterium]|nr:hypothetical protein [Gammaproteobacteria bacterium]
MSRLKRLLRRIVVIEIPYDPSTIMPAALLVIFQNSHGCGIKFSIPLWIQRRRAWRRECEMRGRWRAALAIRKLSGRMEIAWGWDEPVSGQAVYAGQDYRDLMARVNDRSR